jgi:integrase
MSKKQQRKSVRRFATLTIPELEQSKAVVLNTLASAHSRRSYKYAIERFIGWYCDEPRLAFNRSVVMRYRSFLENLSLSAATINLHLSAILVGLRLDQLQLRDSHWVIVDLVGKGGRIRTVPVPNWCKGLVDVWLRDAGVNEGKVFRRVLKNGARQDAGVTANVVWYAVKRCAKRAGIDNLAPHDLRRSCARLCHGCGGELEQIQFLLGHASVQTTERYIGSKQKLQDAVNDRLGISVASDTA